MLSIHSSAFVFPRFKCHSLVDRRALYSKETLKLSQKKEGKNDRVAVVLREDSWEKQSYVVLLAVAGEVAAEVGLPEEPFLSVWPFGWEFGLRVVMFTWIMNFLLSQPIAAC